MEFPEVDIFSSLVGAAIVSVMYYFHSSTASGPCEYCKNNDSDILSYIDKKDFKKERRLARYCPECGRKFKRNKAATTDPRNRGV